MEVNIEGQTYSMELDLGFRGDLNLHSEYVEKIASKTFLKTKPMYGIKGKEFVSNLYALPKAKIGQMAFFESTLQEDSRDFTINSVFLKDGAEPSIGEPGRLGWQFFHSVNLLIDVSNSTIAFCDSLDTLKEQGYLIENVAEVPLLLERGLVEFIGEGPEGPLRCTLDTGCTLNLMNTDIEEEKVAEALWNPEFVLYLPSLKIGEVDFGPQRFQKFPIKLPIRIEATLGMEFFKDHLVFVNFTNKTIYFTKSAQIPSEPPLDKFD